MVSNQATLSCGRNLPALEELRTRPQWVCWRKERRGGKWTKVPYHPLTGKKAASDNPHTWASYAQAVQGQCTGRYDGIGYMFQGDYTGVDLDHCVHLDGSLDPWAQGYLDQLPSYAEYSPSHTGLHILVRGIVPRGLRRHVPGAPQPEAAIEMYSERRYFTVTGAHVAGTPTSIEACPALVPLYMALATARQQPQGALPAEDSSLSDEALLEKALHAQNGANFQALWHGNITGYPSQSEAELALCHLLAFWTGNDATRMDRLFRRSGLYRPEKWDRPARTGESYGHGTIARAIAGCRETYHRSLPGKIIRFRGRLEGVSQKEGVSLPETELDFVMGCLRDEEEGDARLYAHLFRGKCVYDHTEGMWYEWQGHHWERDECKHALLLASGPLASVYLETSAQLAEEAAWAEKRLDADLLQRGKGDDPDAQQYQWLKEMTGALIGRAKALKKLKRAQAVLTYAQAYLRITSREWDTSPWLLACANGVLDLQTGELHVGKPEDYLRTAIPTAWTGLDTPAPRFEQFLQEVFQDKPESERTVLIAFVQRLLGYSITGELSHHIFTIFYGAEGRNGKDTLLDTLKDVLGSLVGAVSNDLFVAQEKFRVSGAPTPHLCDLQGKRLVWGSETRQGDKLNIAQIKLLTGGGEISARQLHGRQFSFAPTHKLLLMTNYKPHADARDQAFWSRACLIEFGIRFVDHPQTPNERQADPTLKAKLKEERSGILAWLVRGCLAWQHQGLAIPSFIRLATEKYRDEEDKILQFIRECCLVQADAYVKASALYEAYKEWCKDNQFGSGMNATLFGNEMSKRFEKRRGNAGMIYQGIGLLASERSVGLVYTSQEEEDNDKRPSEANLQVSEEDESVGCVGFPQVFSPNANHGLHEGRNREKPYTPYTSSTTVKNHKTRSEANPGQINNNSQPYTNPTHPRQYVETVDGLGYLTGNRQEQDVTFFSGERKEQLRYRIGVILLKDGIERFYYPQTLWEARREAIQAYEQEGHA
ncbi:MAG TPA: phage/plasmid primase, P4 family [Ktedonobacteraceae bacterium]|nr:phage/plasmid primase, P4 family [Ktedonobacteraceae bacterium]HZU66236.1 phage/plasmid primase, P4 family [Ktedonobacteraceae bacterium]